MADQDEYVIDVTPGRRRRFGTEEIRDIVIAMLVLSLAFTILYRNNSIQSYLEYHFGSGASWGLLFVICLVLVFFSFLLHEFGHKFTAQRYGMKSEFRLSWVGLLITLVTSFIGFLFAAPGAVVIYGNPDRETNGRIAVAGPVVNVVLAFVGIAGCLLTNYGGIEVLIFSMFAYLNGFLAFFNLLPIPPLDGSKIFAWNKVLYVVVMVVAIAELAYLYLGMPTLYYTLRRTAARLGP